MKNFLNEKFKFKKITEQTSLLIIRKYRQHSNSFIILKYLKYGLDDKFKKIYIFIN